MVKGLDIFRRHFAGHADQFILIGGTAATLAMEGAGLEFRATKDLDIVLHIEALKLAFGSTFWEFIEKGGYEVREASDTYYRFILAGRRELDGLSWIGEDRLIPLKAHAWLDLGERKARGEPVDSKNIRKHANDIIRMSQLLSPESRIPAPPKIAEDLGRFLDAVIADDTYSSKSLGFDIPLSQIAERIALAYQLKQPVRR
jgi:hypothetical protein